MGIIQKVMTALIAIVAADARVLMVAASWTAVMT